MAAVALHHPRRRGRRVGRGEDDDAAAPCAPKALARALYVFLFSMYYISNKKKSKTNLRQAAGCTPRPIRTKPDCLSADRPIRIKSDRFGVQNGSAAGDALIRQS
jgi:hypothetical protein